MAKRKPERPVPAMERLMPAIDARLSEFVDAYLLIAITTDGQPVVINREGNRIQALALRALVADHVMGRSDEQGS